MLRDATTQAMPDQHTEASVPAGLNSALSPWDIAALTLYLIGLFAVYVLSMFRHSRSNTEGYFLAGRNMNWFLIGMSLFSTNIGAEHFLGLASSASKNGVSVAAFEVNAMLCMQLLSWVFVPVLISAGVQTMPEYFTARLGGKRIRSLVAGVYLVLYIFTKISVNIYAGALFINLAFQQSFEVSIVLVLCIAAVFTVGGGLATVMYTDTLMSLVMIAGGLTLTVKAFDKIGGFSCLYPKYMMAIPAATKLLNQSNPAFGCGMPNPNAFRMLRNVNDKYMPWLAFFLGHTPNTIWYWCSDQMMVQRVMAAKSASHARFGTLLTGFLKISPLFLMIFVGIISRILFPDIIGCPTVEHCRNACGKPSCVNLAYPMIVVHVLPPGLKGLMLAVMISALISGLTSLFNSSSTLFTLDIYRLIRRSASNFELMVVGRLFALVLITASTAWIPMVNALKDKDIYTYIQSVNSFFASPIAALYLMSVFWPRLTEPGAFWGLLCGFMMGTIRMTLEMLSMPPGCGESDNRFIVVAKLNFMYFAALNFWITVTVSVIISMFSKRPDETKVTGKTYWMRKTRLASPESADHVKEPNNVEPSSGIGDPTTDIECTMQSTDEQSSIDGSHSSNKLKRIVKLLGKYLCGLDMSDKSPTNVSSPKDYYKTLTKFNETLIPKKSKFAQYLMLGILAGAVVSLFSVLSLNPSLTFNRDPLSCQHHHMPI